MAFVKGKRGFCLHFEDAIREFGFDCRARKLSDRTIGNYQRQLRYLQRYLDAEYRLQQVEAVRSLHLKRFLVSMDDKGRKPQYINDLLKVFKTFFNYLKKEGYILENPAASVRNMKQPKVKIVTFSEEEIRKLLHYYQGRSFLDIRNRTMIALFFDTGMRLTENNLDIWGHYHAISALLAWHWLTGDELSLEMAKDGAELCLDDFEDKSYEIGFYSVNYAITHA